MGQERAMSKSEGISWGLSVLTNSAMNKWESTELNHGWSINVPASSGRKDLLTLLSKELRLPKSLDEGENRKQAVTYKTMTS